MKVSDERLAHLVENPRHASETMNWGGFSASCRNAAPLPW